MWQSHFPAHHPKAIAPKLSHAGAVCVLSEEKSQCARTLYFLQLPWPRLLPGQPCPFLSVLPPGGGQVAAPYATASACSLRFYHQGPCGLSENEVNPSLDLCHCASSSLFPIGVTYHHPAGSPVCLSPSGISHDPL